MQSTRIPSTKKIWLFLLIALLSTGLLGARPMPAPNNPSSSSTIYLPVIFNNFAIPVSYDQGFEGGVMPEGWTVIRTNTSQTWHVASANPYNGVYNILVDQDENMQAVNEILLSPVFTGSHGTVSMFSSGSKEACDGTFNDCDLRMWLVKGAWGGGDDVEVKLVDEDWPGNYIDTQTTIDLSSHLSLGESWRVAWQYTVIPGVEGVAVYMDDVHITSNP